MSAAPRSPLQRRALRAAVAVAARHGLNCDEPVVLHDAGNLVVRLDPAPVVARVATVIATLRPGDAWLSREVAIAAHLVASGAPVVAPSAEIDPGPHEHDGLVMSFWTYVSQADRVLDAREAGRALRLCHEALVSFDDGTLVAMARLDEARADIAVLADAGALADADAALLARAGETVRARVDRLAWTLQPVHGDAHLGNVISGPEGPLWNDWEDAFLGPRLWDLGCLRADATVFGRDAAPTIAALHGYGSAVDDDALDAFVAARRFQGTVWIARMAAHRPDRRARSDGLLAYYRERGGG